MSQARVLVAATVAAGALYLVGFIVLGSPPGASAHPLDVVKWFHDHRHAARVYAWTAAVGTLAFAVMAGLIRSTLPAPSRDVFLLGAGAFIAETAVQAWFWGALALHPGSLRPVTARLVLEVASYWGPILTGATTAMIGSVTVLGIGRRPLIPRWLTAAGVVAFAEQAAETVTVFGRRGFIEPGGDMNVLLGGLLTAAWIGALVVWSATRLARDGATSGREVT
jgi:hypothetical protein